MGWWWLITLFHGSTSGGSLQLPRGSMFQVCLGLWFKFVWLGHHKKFVLEGYYLIGHLHFFWVGFGVHVRFRVGKITLHVFHLNCNTTQCDQMQNSMDWSQGTSSGHMLFFNHNMAGVPSHHKISTFWACDQAWSSCLMLSNQDVQWITWKFSTAGRIVTLTCFIQTLFQPSNMTQVWPMFQSILGFVDLTWFA